MRRQVLEGRSWLQEVEARVRAPLESAELAVPQAQQWVSVEVGDGKWRSGHDPGPMASVASRPQVSPAVPASPAGLASSVTDLAVAAGRAVTPAAACAPNLVATTASRAVPAAEMVVVALESAAGRVSASYARRLVADVVSENRWEVVAAATEVVVANAEAVPCYSSRSSLESAAAESVLAW